MIRYRAETGRTRQTIVIGLPQRHRDTEESETNLRLAGERVRPSGYFLIFSVRSVSSVVELTQP